MISNEALMGISVVCAGLSAASLVATIYFGKRIENGANKIIELSKQPEPDNGASESDELDIYKLGFIRCWADKFGEDKVSMASVVRILNEGGNEYFRECATALCGGNPTNVRLGKAIEHMHCRYYAGYSLLRTEETHVGVRKWYLQKAI